MEEEKRKRLQEAGWRVGNVEQFLGLAPHEVAFLETKLSLARGLKRERTRQGLTQAAVASRIGSSQSRVAKMEAADESVSLDLLVRSLLKMGVDRDFLAALLKATPDDTREPTAIG